MSTPATRAALRILMSVPGVQIRTHQRKWQDFEDYRELSRKPTPAESERLHERIMALLAEGHTGVEVAALVGVHPVTVSKHKTGKVKAK